MKSGYSKSITSLFVTLIAIWVLIGSLSSAFAIDRNLFHDVLYQKGFKHYDGTSGLGQTFAGNLQTTTVYGAPLWQTTQWNCFKSGSLYDGTTTTLGPGAYRWQTSPLLGEAITVGKAGDALEGITLYVDSNVNFTSGGLTKFRSATFPDNNGHWNWPSLYVHQDTRADCPWLSELTEVDFNLDAVLVKALNNHGNDQYGHAWDDGENAAICGLNASIQNQNTASPGYGQLLWFTVNLYDDREPLPQPHTMFDAGTGTGNYAIGLPFCASGLSVGTWKSIRGDILSEMKKALQYAWDSGYCTGSYTYSDYKWGGWNLFWEVNGLSTVSMQLKNLSINVGTDPGRTYVTDEIFSGTPSNNFSGYRGYMVTVGTTSPIVVTAMGRYALSGNSGTHTTKLVVANTKADVGGTAASVNTNITTQSTFAYTNLQDPVKLTTGTTYYILSYESNGGDSWYAATSPSSCQMYHTDAATLIGPAYKADGGSWTTGTATDKGNGPVTFRYARQFAKSEKMTSGTYNTYTGYRGTRLLVGSDPITVTGLGRYVCSNNSQTHTLKIMDAATKTDLTSGTVDVNLLGAAAGTYKYGMLDYPVTLDPGNEYWLLSSETVGGDKANIALYTTISPTNVASVLGAVYGNGSSWTTGTSTNACNGPLTILYTSPK